MAHIRSDLEGVVVVRGKSGLSRPITLRAGDKVPKGITVGDHLTGPAPRQSQSRRRVPSKPATPAAPATQQEPAAPASEGQEQQTSEQGGVEQSSAPSAATADAAGGSDGAQKPEEGPAPDKPPASGPGSDKGAWRRYAQHLGIELDGDATRADIQAAVEAHEQS